MSKPRIYHYDTTYEQEAEDGTVTASVELRIYFTVTPGGGDGWNEPYYDGEVEFHSAGVEVPGPHRRQYRDLGPKKSMADDILIEWAWVFVEDHQDLLLEVAGDRDADAADYAAEMRDEMRREQK